MDKSTVYIDESGDLGCKTGTRWFVITAVVVKKENENDISSTMNYIRKKLKVKEIHLKKISDFYKRSFIVREVDNTDFTYVNVIADTEMVDYSKIKSAKILYNYMCRMLLERVSWFLRDEGRTADIILSSRGQERDNELIYYIKNKLIPSTQTQISSGIFGEVSARKAKELDFLQLADVCATTTFLAYEEKNFGLRTPCFFNILKEHLYKHNGKINKYGIKYFSDSMEDEVRGPQRNFPCHKK